MPLTDKTLIFDPSGVSCLVEPVVLFGIIDHYSRRDEAQKFVVGSLLGTEENGVVTICSSFPVPYTEVEDQIALNSDFHATMLSLQQKVKPKEKVVGWYMTGAGVTETTSLFHEFYGQDVERPVHLLFDLGLNQKQIKGMSCKAYVSQPLTLGEELVTTVFREIACTILSGESDRVGIDTLLKMTGERDAAAAKGGAPASDSSSELAAVEQTVRKLQSTLEGVTDFVEKVVNGKQTADPATVRLLQGLVAAAPRLPTEAFSKMFNTQVQDMLTIVYLANLTRTQLVLAEKLADATLNSNP